MEVIIDALIYILNAIYVFICFLTLLPLVMVAGILLNFYFRILNIETLYRCTLEIDRRKIIRALVKIRSFSATMWSLFQSVFTAILDLFETPGNAEVQFDVPHHPLRVGETFGFKIKALLKSQSLEKKKRLLEGLSIEIKQKFGQDHEGIALMKELICVDRECSLAVKFKIKKSGDYDIRIMEGVRHVRGSPFTWFFLPGSLDVEKTEFLRPSPYIVCIDFEEKILHVKPKDKYENLCSVSYTDLDKFEFELKHSDGQQAEQTDLCRHHFFNSGDYVGLKLKFLQCGFFNGEITYNHQTILFGKFDLVCISSDREKNCLNQIIQNPDRSWVPHEAKLLVVGSELRKGEKIYIYVCPKQLHVKDYFWKIFPIRIATYRVTPMTKLTVLLTNCSTKTHTLSISDGIQKVVVEMDSMVARRVVALFSHFVEERIGGSESFIAKQKHFYEQLYTLQRTFRMSSRVLRIDRSQIIETTYNQTKALVSKDWYKNFRIQFIGESGVDAGGLRREWLDVICVKFFEHNPAGLFSSLGNSRLVHPNPAGNRTIHWPLKYYELAGKIVGKCLFETAIGSSNQQMVNGRFSKSFLAQVLGLRPSYRHFELDDPELYLTKVKYILENDVEVLDLTFTEEEYNSAGKLVKVVDLVPSGSKLKVTEKNKEDYLNELANYKLGMRVTKEIESFRKGLHELVPDDLLMNFDENELEILWCGKSHFNVEDLKKHFARGSWTLDGSYNRVLEWFWMSVSSFSDDEKARLLQFTTGSSLLPHTGFKGLNPQFKISLSPEYGRLPIAHTCVNEICISDNSTFEMFDKSLRLAINEGSQGFEFR